MRRPPTRGLRAPCAAACALATALALGGCEELGLGDGGPPPLPPKLTFAETTYDFGRAAQGAPVEHRFAFTNDGGTDLTIINLRAGCDCDATVIDTREVVPHGAGAVRVRFDTNAVYGAQRRTITVYSNDLAQRAVVLTMTGDVLLDVAPEPAQVYLGVVPPGAPLLHAVAVRTGSEAVHLGAPESDAPQLTVQLDAASDGTAATLAIGIAGNAPLGPFSTVVRLPTTSPQHPMLRIPVAGIIAADAPAPRSLAPPSQPGAGGTASPTACPDGP